MKKTVLALALGTAMIAPAAHANNASAQTIVQNYANLVYTDYGHAYQDALTLQSAINTFLDNPTDKTLNAAKQAWLASRNAYGQTEAFRFYEGPIDYVDENGHEGPESRLNAWPIDESYIDYVKGNPKSGIVNNPNVKITKASLTDENQADDEAQVSTGYHAIEFLLWGQDLNPDGPGNRPATDYAKTPKNERRRAYLKTVTSLLVDDLKFLVDQWTPGQDNYARTFVKDKDALAKILTGLATLSGFELAAERMGTALDSGDQEDEQSCFSDNTHNDFIENAQGIFNVFFASGLYEYIKAKDDDLAEELEDQLKDTQKLVAAIPHPIDRDVLASPQGSPARAKMEAAIASLQKQADLFKEAGKALGLNVQIVQ